ncbi:MAG TPA: endonuclease/exonuclease/phosphatase family protein [Patescibacteria group bacterium]|jgi:endonuclease/exonuclease/phosphatase family metal-dependent hydrolase|nr:endonuclease/exonuclease/phosphatase family protein [Patescibacteria group bacterium]
MKILSFNIAIKVDNSEAVAKYLQESNADIICLQEAIRPLDKGVEPLYRSEEYIRESLQKDYPYYFFAPQYAADKFIRPERVVYREFGGVIEQGMLILSKFPIVHGFDYFYRKNYEYDNDRVHYYEGDDHGRSFQVCEIDVNGQTIQVGNVHGLYSEDKLDSEQTIAQTKFFIEKLKLKNLPSILVGDFNLLPETESMKVVDEVYQNLNAKFNVASTRSKGQVIDYIFTSPEFTAINLQVDQVDISDHYPVIAEINL